MTLDRFKSTRVSEYMGDRSMIQRTKLLVATMILILPGVATAWEGQESDTGDLIEIESGNLVRSGEGIEVYNYDEGTYDFYEVEQVNRYGGQVEIEVYDYKAGEYKTLIMED
jgi:hypothetical protein